MNHNRNFNKNGAFTRPFNNTQPKIIIPNGLSIDNYIKDKIVTNGYINKSGKFCYELNVGSRINEFENNTILNSQISYVKLYYSENAISIVSNNIQMLANALDVMFRFNDRLKGSLNGVKEEIRSLVINTTISIQQYKHFSKQITKSLMCPMVNHKLDNTNLLINGPKSQVAYIEQYYNSNYKDMCTVEIEFDCTDLQRFWNIQDRINQALFCIPGKKYVQISGKKEEVANAVSIFEQVINANKKKPISQKIETISYKKETSNITTQPINYTYYESFEEVEELDNPIEEPLKSINKDTAPPTGKGIKKIKGGSNSKTKKIESNTYDAGNLEAYAIVEKIMGNGYVSVKIISSVNNGKIYNARICGSMRYKKHNKLKGSKIINIKDYVMVSFREFEDKADILMKVPDHIISKMIPVKESNYNDMFDYSEDSIDNLELMIEGI